MKRAIAFLTGLSIAFYTLNIEGFGRTWSVGLIMSVFYFLCTFSMIKGTKFVPEIRKCIVYSALFAFFLFLVNFANMTSHYNTPVFPMTIVMCWLLFVLFLVHSNRDSEAVTIALYGFSFGAAILAVCFYTGIGVSIDGIAISTTEMRFTVFGSNSNQLGIYESVGIAVVLNEFIFYDRLNLRMFRWIFVIPIILMAGLVIATVSRTGFLMMSLTFILSTIMSPIASKNKFYTFIILALVVFLVIVGARLFLSSDSYIAERWLSAIEDKDVSGRDLILEDLWPYVKDNFLFGVGETGYVEISQKVFGKISLNGDVQYGFSPHNVLFEILLYNGVIGLVLMLMFWMIIAKRAFVHRKLYGNSTPFVLFILLLIQIILGHVLTDKDAWLLYAYILVLPQFNKRRNKI